MASLGRVCICRDSRPAVGNHAGRKSTARRIFRTGASGDEHRVVGDLGDLRDHLVCVSNATTIFVVFMTAMPLIITNVWQGTHTVNVEFIELAQVLRMPHWKVMTKIYLPTILPYFFSGARLAFGFGWRVSLVAETIGSSSGVGYRLRQAADLIQTDQVFAWTLTLVMMMATIEMGLLKPLENHLFRWKKEAEGQ